MSKKKKVAGPTFPITVEVFRDPTYYIQQMGYSAEAPTCFNGMVNIRRYRVTAELIEEPREVLVERLHKLWREAESHNAARALEKVAAELGVELDPITFMVDRKK